MRKTWIETLYGRTHLRDLMDIVCFFGRDPLFRYELNILWADKIYDFITFVFSKISVEY